MDYFALGGILVFESDIDGLIKSHKAFMHKWELDYPLHSSRIRGRRGTFSWLATDAARGAAFLADLHAWLVQLPVVGIACVIDRPGYVARYSERFRGQPWLMCKTAFAILVERATKYANRSGGKLEIFFEPAGKSEDRDIKSYMRALKRDGMPFDPDTSSPYEALKPDDFKSLVLGEPRERTKNTPMIQVADLYLYPMVKGGYDPTYAPYRGLLEAGRLIDSILKDDQRALLGVKYSCFDHRR
jgi:hypothetical protein